ncbi:MAG: PD40 domain-containing protein [Anaerolineales bacterium]|nr:PD40 domain-containing protein [Anaerolineales bacterium]
MNKYFWLLPTLLILTACAAAQASPETLRRLDQAAWSTPRPTTAAPTPTLFPKISRADLGTPTPTPVVALFEAAVEPTNTATSQPPVENKPAVTPETLAIPEGFAQARVNSVALNVRQGPGASYEVMGTVLQGEQVPILAVNPTHDWALVRLSTGGEGWVSLAYLTVDGSLADAPVREGRRLKIEDSGLKIEDSGRVVAISENSEIKDSMQLSSPTPYPLLLTPYPAHIIHQEAAIRPGPGSEYAPIDTLSDDQALLEVLAVDQSREWALVKPQHGRLGWMAVADLAVAGDVKAAPQVVTTWIANNGLILHRGPGIYFDEIGPVPTNSLMLVLGLNEGRSWALVAPALGGGQGWLPLQFITPSVPAAEIPVVEGEEGVAIVNGQQSMVNRQFLNPNPHLVFQLASGGEIMVINTDGTGLRRLTSGLDPALSPDGQRVAFTRWQGESGSLWTINLDGTQERQILGFTKQAKGPAWSPDGQQIVVNFQHEGRLNSEINCADVLKNPGPAIPWNADVPTDRNGDPKVKIRVDMKDFDVKAMLCWKLPPDPHWGLRVVNVADGKFEDVDGGTYAFRPTWDPTQPWRIISDGGRGLVEADINQKTSRRLTDEIGDSSPVFSPDGRYLLVTMDQGGGTDIYRLNAECGSLPEGCGSGRVRLTKTPLWVTAMPDKAKPWHNVSPAWSPDGSRIAFLTDRAGRWEVWVINVDGSNAQPLFAEEVNNQLQITYNFVDEHVLSWR